MVRISTTLGLGFLLLVTAAQADARCLRFEPAVETLTGTLRERVMPGPPGYQSIGRGDYPEDVLFLELEEP